MNPRSSSQSSKGIPQVRELCFHMMFGKHNHHWHQIIQVFLMFAWTNTTRLPAMPFRINRKWNSDGLSPQVSRKLSWMVIYHPWTMQNLVFTKVNFLGRDVLLIEITCGMTSTKIMENLFLRCEYIGMIWLAMFSSLTRSLGCLM